MNEASGDEQELNESFLDEEQGADLVQAAKNQRRSITSAHFSLRSTGPFTIKAPDIPHRGAQTGRRAACFGNKERELSPAQVQDGSRAGNPGKT